MRVEVVRAPTVLLAKQPHLFAADASSACAACCCELVALTVAKQLTSVTGCGLYRVVACTEFSPVGRSALVWRVDLQVCLGGVQVVHPLVTSCMQHKLLGWWPGVARAVAFVEVCVYLYCVAARLTHLLFAHTSRMLAVSRGLNSSGSGCFLEVVNPLSPASSMSLHKLIGC